ncbi:hypothetical protein GCM10010404_88180 [Nonomuraea africana]|uniref:Sensor histidine kinase n=1 Tax=Nonomuraea africana TaxID=46171 RepID=A0ABR9KJM6_9ACTN|nr:hypothetical protein [Nonomuraea africana]MBE1562220.1 hypothetical protein [Nonomuraea africana]
MRRWLWLPAFVLSLIPYAVTTGSLILLWTPRQCPGWAFYLDLPGVRVPAPLTVAVGFVVWAVLAHRGLLRLGRVVGWLAAAGVGWSSVAALGAALYDTSAGGRCGELWGKMLSPPWQALDVLIAVLIVLAVRTERGLVLRTASAVTALVFLATLPTGAAVLPRVTPAEAEGCESAEGERAFVCAVRELLPASYASLPDHRLVAEGRTWCEVIMRDSPEELSRVGGSIGQSLYSGSIPDALTAICPELGRWRANKELREEEENDRFVTAAERRCAGLPPHRPLARTVTRARATAVWSDYGAIELAEGEIDVAAALDDAFENGVVGTSPGQVAILTADEAMHVCVAVEVYGRRPPVETRGWRKVVETGYTSRSGRLAFDDERTALSTNGPGRYRLRVHMRIHDEEDAGQEFLIMVFPGKGGGTTRLK